MSHINSSSGCSVEFRDLRTEKVFINASSQTLRIHLANEGVSDRCCHDKQSYQSVSQASEPVRVKATQISNSEFYPKDENIKKLVNESIHGLDESLMDKSEHATRMQQIFRGYSARKQVKAWRSEQNDEADASQGLDFFREKEQEIQRRLHPNNEADFEVLLSELEIWKANELQKIQRDQLAREARVTLKKELLAKETLLLRKIDMMKKQSHLQIEKKRIDKFLTEMATPQRWELRNGDEIEVTTIGTVRAAKVKSLYSSLTNHQDTSGRRETLLAVRSTVKELKDHKLARKIGDLIDREIKMTAIGRTGSSLSSLRSRVSNLFLDLMNDPTFNPESARFVRDLGRIEE